jgi:hypothetical protein
MLAEASSWLILERMFVFGQHRLAFCHTRFTRRLDYARRSRRTALYPSEDGALLFSVRIAVPLLRRVISPARQ